MSGEGGRAKVSFNASEGEKKYLTLTLDDAMEKYSLPRIDFIKMDVEGAEYPILQGAVQTLKKFKPKLAISIYHSDDDFDRIPRFLDLLGCGYEFAIGHYSLDLSETILYAIVKN